MKPEGPPRVGKPEEVLGLPATADPEELRRRYLELVRQFPPDREPQQFHAIRDAYEQLRDPRRRAADRLEVDPDEPLVNLADRLERRFVGPDPWLKVLKGGAR